MADDRNELLFSVASGWEIAIKASLGKLDNVPEDLKGFMEQQISLNAFEILPVRLEHALSVYSLPLHHKDPFDRLLIAQALAEDVPLVTKDSDIASYPVDIIW